MPRIAWRTFDRGLWLAGGRDSVPDGAVRRANGVAQLREGAVRSARGLREIDVNLEGANRIVRFGGALFYGAGADVFREGVAVQGAFAQAPSPHVAFLRAPPQPELTDWLFVAGGGAPFKVRADGTGASRWGIEAPADGATATRGTRQRKQIASCDDAGGTWVRQESAGAAQGQNATTFVEGVSALEFAFTQASVSSYVKAVVTDLNTFGAVQSADQDYIELWVRLGGASGTGESGASKFVHMELAFALGTDDFANAFVHRIDGSDDVVSQAGLSTQRTGTTEALTDATTAAVQSRFPTADTRAYLNAIAQTSIMRQNDVWQRIRLSKASFERAGADTSWTWADVVAVRLTFTRSGAVTILIDDIALAGGAGLVGTYKYLFTFKNSTTGSRSDANATPVLVEEVDRQAIVLDQLPQSADPQVDFIEAWRTFGNGEAYFKAWEVAVGTTTYTDTVADFVALFTGAHLTTDPDVLATETLPLDNAPPPATIGDVLATTDLGRAWWLDRAAGQEGRLFYSPAGRPESNAGFIEVTNTDDPLQRVIRWNDVVYILSTKALFRRVGDEEPFVAQEVFGVPGTTAPDTVVASPFGLLYWAPDGPRLFDGAQSTLLGFDALAPLWRGLAAEDFTAFVGLTAAYFREDYWLSDGGNQTLIADLRSGAWRAYSEAFDTLYGSDTDDELLGAANNRVDALDGGRVFALEDPAATASIRFALQTPATRIAVDTLGVVQRLFVEAESGDVAVTPTLIVDDVELALPPFTAPSRTTIEYAVLARGRVIAVRLDATTTTATIRVYGIEVDVYVPGGET